MSIGEQQVALFAAAVAQLELALRESQGPVQTLGEAIVSLGTGLAADADRADLQREVSKCLEALQFYDRMTQHLSHIRDFVSGMTASMDAALSGEENEDVWDELRARFRRRLISDPQREMLDILAPAVGASVRSARASREHHADQGSIELF